MGTKMQNRIGLKLLAQVTIKGRKSMRRRELLLKKQAHWVAFVAKGWLHTDKYTTEVKPVDKNRLPIALKATWRGAPLRTDRVNPGLAFDVAVNRDAGRYIGNGPITHRITMQESLAQILKRSGQFKLIALTLKALEQMPKRCKNIEMGCGTKTARVGRKAKNHDCKLSRLR